MEKTISITVKGCVKCQGEGPMKPGDQARLVLFEEKLPGLPEQILGTVQAPVISTQIYDEDTKATVDGTRYSISYQTSDLLGASATEELELCYVERVECVSCCIFLGERLDSVESRLNAVETVPSSEGEVHREYDAIIDIEFDVQNPTLPNWFPGFSETAPSSLGMRSERGAVGGIDAAGRAGLPGVNLGDVGVEVSTRFYAQIIPRNGDTFFVIYAPSYERDARVDGVFVDVAPTIQSNLRDEDTRTGDEFVVKWRWFNGRFTQPVVVEWPRASLTTFKRDGQSFLRFTDKTGRETTWRDVQDEELPVEKIGKVCSNPGAPNNFGAAGQWEDIEFDQGRDMGNLESDRDGFTMREVDEGLYKMTLFVLADNVGVFGPPPADPSAAIIDIAASINGNDPEELGLSIAWETSASKVRQEITQLVELGRGDTLGLSAKVDKIPPNVLRGSIGIILERVSNAQISQTGGFTLG